MQGSENGRVVTIGSPTDNFIDLFTVTAELLSVHAHKRFRKATFLTIALFTSAQIGKTVLLKRTVSFFFIFPKGKDVKKRKSWVNAVNRTDWSPHEIFSNFIMFGALLH